MCLCIVLLFIFQMLEHTIQDDWIGIAAFPGQMLYGFFFFFCAAWMHNDGQSRKLPEEGNPVSALLGSLGRKGFGSYRFI